MDELKTINFLTCGHVDDGKSTLIGRLLHDIHVVPDDHIEAARGEDGSINFALFTDGLEDERRQGITIDVAHRYFRYEGCRYRIADTPGHLEYMRNMAVAAVESDIAVILVDALHGVRLQTVEYSKIARFFGVRQFLVAINKMDAVEYSQEQFENIKADYLEAFEDPDQPCSIDFIPVSALLGDNIVQSSKNTPWYKGRSVLEYLQNAERHTHTNHSLRLPIQHVVKDEQGTRWYVGTLHGQPLHTGAKLTCTQTAQSVTVTGIYHSGKPVERAERRQAIAISLAEDIDLTRGSVLSEAGQPEPSCDEFKADILWVDKKYEDKERFLGLIKLAHAEEQAEIVIEDATNQNGVLKSGTVALARPLAMDSYSNNPHTGLFIMIDPHTERVSGVGTVSSVG